MHYAHILYEYDRQLTVISNVQPDWSTSMRNAWKIQHVRDAMLAGAVLLRYVNKHGDELERIGTLRGSFIPSDSAPKGIRQQEIDEGLALPNWEVVNYYDLDKKGWRSFNITSLLSVEKLNAEVILNYTPTGDWLY